MKLEQFAETALINCGIAPGVPLLVGVSGGPDSLCLLHGLARLGIPVTAAHFDHGLRPESAQDAETVRETAARLEIPFLTERQDAAAYASQERLTVEEAARVLRYRFLFARARAVSAQAVAVGHTADDQVETVLMHLLRGAGLSGLAGMAFRSIIPDWDAAIPLVRPLLPFWRAETLAYCEEHGLAPVFDPSNQDTAFFRNRLRHELLPYLETYNPQVRQALWRTAQTLAADLAVVQSAVREALNMTLAAVSETFLGLDRQKFQSLEVGLRRGVLRSAAALLLSPPGRALQNDFPAARDLDFAAIERALRWIASPGSGQIDLVQGLRLRVEGDLIWLSRSETLSPGGDWPQLAGENLDLPVPGAVTLGPGWRLVTAWKEAADVPPAFTSEQRSQEAWLDADSLPGPLSLRRPLPGDRFQPLGMDGRSVKLSDFWINQKLPRRARAGYPLVVSGGAVVWVPGYRLAHPYRIHSSTRRVLHLRLEREH